METSWKTLLSLVTGLPDERWKTLTLYGEDLLCPVVDPAFPSGRKLPRGTRQPIILQKFCRKLHENEGIWTENPPLVSQVECGEGWQQGFCSYGSRIFHTGWVPSHEFGTKPIIRQVFLPKTAWNDRNWTAHIPGFPFDPLLFCVFEGILPSFHLFGFFSGSVTQRNVPAMQLGLLVSSDRAPSRSTYIKL